MAGSEVARLMAQIAAEEESAQLAMSGFAQTGSHDIIVHKFEFDTEEVRRLFAAGKDSEAEALWESLEW